MSEVYRSGISKIPERNTTVIPKFASRSERLIYILGCKIDDISLSKALQKVKGFFDNKDGSWYIVTPNPEICLRAEQDQEYQQILNGAFLALPDGFGLKLGAAILGQRLKNRVTGVDFTLGLMRLAAKKGFRVFLFGGSKGIAQRCKKVLERRYKGLRIMGVLCGESQISKFSPAKILKNLGGQESQNQISNLKTDVITEINQTKPDILLVALGAPLQERWIAEHLEHLITVKLAIGIGGTFDFISSKVKRAPRLIRQVGLEWLWRLAIEPWRIRRIYNATLKFLAVVLRWRLRMRFVYRRNVVGLIVKGGRSSVVERLLPKQKIAGSNPVARSTLSVDFNVPPIQILLVEREDEPGHWQLPQGGIDEGESAQQSIKREMQEELGTDKFTIIKHIPRFHKYKWPELDQLRRGYHGQIQDLFVLQFLGQDQDIKLDQREHVNFKWVDVERAVSEVHEVRREQAEKAVMILRQHQ